MQGEERDWPCPWRVERALPGRTWKSKKEAEDDDEPQRQVVDDERAVVKEQDGGYMVPMQWKKKREGEF